MFRYTIATAIFGLIGFSSCEKVIDIPLNEAEQRVVVEGLLMDQPGNNYIILSKTGSVYQESDFEKLSGATVTITDEAGTIYTLTEMPGMPGVYNHPTLEVLVDNDYDLSVTYNSEIFTSSVQTFYKPQLDSLNYLEQSGSFGPQTDTTYLVFFSFSDNANQDNYYRINVYVNGVKDPNYYITNDDLFNGETYTQPAFATAVEKGDTVVIELLSVDESNYDYFFSLSSNGSDDPFSPTPSNPVSNIEGGAIGYFGAYTSDTMSVIIPQ